MLASALVIVAWKYGGASDTGVVPPPPKPTKKHHATRTHQRQTPPTTAQTGVRLVVRATRGDSGLEVHRGTPVGPLEYQGTLLKGQQQIFTNRRLWLTIDVPANVVVTAEQRQEGAAARRPGRRPARQDGLAAGQLRPRAAVVLTGCELVRGERTDRNGPFLARELVRLGFEPAA